MTEEFKHHWRMEKVLTLNEAEIKARELKATGKTIATVNGSFDLVHAGHLDMLEEAKQQADILFVGLNSDRSVKDGKGDHKPIIPEVERAAMLAALACTDYIVILDVVPYNTAQDVLLRAVKPNVHVNGSEYGTPETWIDWPVMQEVGAKGHVVQRRPGLASSDIIKKIQQTF